MRRVSVVQTCLAATGVLPRILELQQQSQADIEGVYPLLQAALSLAAASHGASLTSRAFIPCYRSTGNVWQTTPEQCPGI